MDTRIEDAYTIFETINEVHFHKHIPIPTIRLSARMTRTAGQVSFKPWEMALSIPYHDYHGWDEELWDTIGHEMVHLYLWKIGHCSDHTSEFKTICARIGATRWAKPMPRTGTVYVYTCPGCHGRLHLRRRYRRATACGRCCRIHNCGRYAEKFKLEFVYALKEGGSDTN